MKETARIALAALCLSVSTAPGQTTAAIGTKGTILELRANAAGPRLARVGTWRNQVSENLIDSVFVDGRAVAVRWKFSRQLSHVASERVAFVYECASPKLRLTWEWKAPASDGPSNIQFTFRI